MAEKNRKRNKAIAAALAERKTSLEQRLPPPPAAIYDPDAVAQVPDTVRDQQFGLYVDQLFQRQDAAAAEAARLAAQAEAFSAEERRYQDAYDKRGATTDEERGAVLSGQVTTERLVKILLAVAAVLFASKVL